jgi:protein kinase A
MEQEKLNKHYLEYDIFLKRAKKDFEGRYKVPEFKPNADISDFQLIKTLGAGSFGRVILVKHKTKSDKLYAMKCMDKFHIVKSKQVAHTMYEIRVLDAVRFDFIVNLDFFFKDNVYLFVVMPFVNGGEMFSHLRNMKKFDETLSKFYAAQVILAFEYLHFLGMVYRDLKPENILIDKDGYLKVTDLGFAKKIDDQRTYTLCGESSNLQYFWYHFVVIKPGFNLDQLSGCCRMYVVDGNIGGCAGVGPRT